MGTEGLTVGAAGPGTATGAAGAGVVAVGAAGRGAGGVAPTGGVGGAGTVNVGLTTGVGTTIFGAGGAGGVGIVGVGAAAAGLTGLCSTAGVVAAKLGGAAGAGVCCLRIALSTSPGREIWERSILVLISSLLGRLVRPAFAAVDASLAERKCARTFSASCSSRELECVFFSVTPTSVSTSRIALLLTSSSLARSLIRILLIRALRPPDCPLSLHINLTVSLFAPFHFTGFFRRHLAPPPLVPLPRRLPQPASLRSHPGWRSPALAPRPPPRSVPPPQSLPRQLLPPNPR